MGGVTSTKLRHITLPLICLIFITTIISINVSISEETPEYDAGMQRMIEEVNKQIQKPDCTAPIIELSQGKLCGTAIPTISGKKANAYLGIPFAESTGGENRWRPPVPDSGWEGTLKATSLGPACPQANFFDPELPYSEDCLTVNVWVPGDSSGAPRAVMLFIFGGSYREGYNGDPLFDGSYNSANRDVVVVNINYRLGSLGFMAGLRDKKTGEDINGNFGLLDQVLAIEWVKDNIQKFGGDPANITLHGQSAGAGSAAIHLTGPGKVKELFQRVIIESAPLGVPLNTVKKARPIAKKFARNLGCGVDDMICMRSKTVKDIVKAQDLKHEVTELTLHGLSDFLIWAPVIDGKVVTGQPLKIIEGDPIKKPVMIGTNKNEALLFVSYAMNILNLKHLSDSEYSLALDVLFRNDEIKDKVLGQYPPQGKNNEMVLSKVITDYLFTCPTLRTADNSSKETWVYLFDHIPSFNILSLIDIDACSKAVCHGMELTFVFHTAENMGFSFKEQEKALSNVMGGYWTNFAMNNDPNNRSAPKWPEYKSRDSNVILVTPINKIDSRKDLKAKCEFWHEIGYQIHTDFWDMF